MATDELQYVEQLLTLKRMLGGSVAPSRNLEIAE